MPIFSKTFRVGRNQSTYRGLRYLFSEDTDKYNDFQTKNNENDDKDFAKRGRPFIQRHYRRALHRLHFTNPDDETKAERQTLETLADLGETLPLTHVQGDRQKITGSDVAAFPIPLLRKQSLFGFVNAEPSKIDDIRHTVPMLIRVRDQIFPSLAL